MTRLSAVPVVIVVQFVVTVVLTVLVVPARAEASVGTVLAVNDLPTVINNLTAWIVGISATVATFFLTWGFLRYMTAGGDPGQLEKAKLALRNAAIGYAGTLLAPVLVTILKQILGA
ncbi:MAG: pilin [Mycobacteriales bacterium]